MIILQQTRGLLSSNDQLSLDLQFAADKSLNSRVGPTPTLTRASSGTFINSNGFIETATNNIPRFDHDPATLESRGLLIESARTNLLPRSTEFNDSTSWSIVRLVSQPTADTHTSPANTLTAEKLVPSTTNDNHRIDRATVSGLVSGTVYTVSVFVKADGYTGFGISFGSSPTGTPTRFDLQTGTVSGTISGWTAKIDPYPNGWYRCSTTFTWTSGARLYLYVGQTGTTFSYAGDGTSGVLVWGAQMEAGEFVTSPILTTTSTLARSADVCNISGSAFDDLYNVNEGTFIADAAALGFSTTNNGIFRVAGVLVVFNRAAQSNRLSASLASQVLTVPSNYNTVRTYYKSAVSASSSGADFVINGTQIADSFSGSSLIPTSSLLTFNDITSAFCNNWIKSFRYYRRSFPVAKLEALTAP